MRRRVRRVSEELIAARHVLIAVIGALALIGATPSPAPLLPRVKLHTEFLVEVNKLGQVTQVHAGKTSPDPTFNAQTYGNALQAFIRTTDGKVVLGTYRLSYDYDPQTQRVRRTVALVKVGGVDPDAQGAPKPNPVPSVRIEAP